MPDALESHETPKNIKIIERAFALEIKIASVLEKKKKKIIASCSHSRPFSANQNKHGDGVRALVRPPLNSWEMHQRS